MWNKVDLKKGKEVPTFSQTWRFQTVPVKMGPPAFGDVLVR